MRCVHLAPPPAHAERLRGPRDRPRGDASSALVDRRHRRSLRVRGQQACARHRPDDVLRGRRQAAGSRSKSIGATCRSAASPPYLRDAVVAVEDHRFHSHLGIDPIGIGRAVVRDMRAGGLEEGGSTLTQQLARTLFLTASRGDWTRKGKEAVLALMIEQRLSKPQILELYLNRIYLGGNVYGVEAMSQNVFGKAAADLTLSEGGVHRRAHPHAVGALAVVALRPRRCSAATSSLRACAPKDSSRRRPSNRPARRRPASSPIPASIEAPPDTRRTIFGSNSSAAFEDDNPPDWKVRTTFVPALQREAERAVTQGLAKFRQAGLQAALVVHRSAYRRRARAGRRARLPAHPVQSRDRREAPARLGVQAVSLRGRARKRHVADFAGLRISTICACPATTSGK